MSLIEKTLPRFAREATIGYDGDMSFYDDEYLRDIPVTRNKGKRCVVCGTKGENCVSSEAYAGPKHMVTLGKDEMLARKDEVILKEDVFQDTEISPGIWSRTLVGRAGSAMKKKKAMDLGII
jgi:hypothetical protein